MNLKSQLLSISDNIFDEFLEDIIDVVDSNKRTAKPGPRYKSITPDAASPIKVGTTIRAGALPSSYDSDFQRTMGLSNPSYSSPIPGLDQGTYNKLNKLAESAISEPKTKRDIMSLFNIPGLNSGAFGKVTGNRIAVGLNGQIVFRTPQGTYVQLQTDDEGNKTQLEVLDLKMDVDFYRVPTQTLTVGDLIELDGQLLYVEENNKGGIKFVNPLTGAKSSKLQRNNILGIHFYSKIVSLFDLAGQQQGVGLNGINPLMLMALQGKNGASGDISELLLMTSLMGSGAQGGQAPAFNPMMLMMLGDKAEGDTFKQFMMLQMMAGQNGANPFATISANVPAAPVVTKKKVAAKKATAQPAKKASAKTAAQPAKKATAKKSSPRTRASQVEG